MNNRIIFILFNQIEEKSAPLNATQETKQRSIRKQPGQGLLEYINLTSLISSFNSLIFDDSLTSISVQDF